MTPETPNSDSLFKGHSSVGQWLANGWPKLDLPSATVKKIGTMIEDLHEDLQGLYKSLYDDWNKYLASSDVIFPENEGKMMELLCLYSNLGEPISQDQMADWIRGYGGSYNRQARHLGGKNGWYIVSGNSRASLIPHDDELEREELMLVSTKEANPIWLQRRVNDSQKSELPSVKIKRLTKELKEYWKSNLKAHNVDFPSTESKLLPLLALFDNIRKPLTQDEISAWLSRFGGKYNRQARHLAGNDGWYIVTGNKRSTLMEYDENMSNNQLMLFSVESANPIWINQRKVTRIYELASGDWEDMLAVFSGRGCAVCGRHFPHYDKGHLNPELPMNLENIVPMCVECNNWAGASNIHFILDKRTLVARPSRNSRI